MESLLHFLNKQSYGVYSDKENTLIAEYLTGKTKFEKIEPFLKPVRYLENKAAICAIGREVTKDKELIPRLGRFLHMIKKNMHISIYYDFVTTLSVSDLTIEDLYAKSELGISTLLADVLKQLSTGHSWKFQAKALGYDSYPAFFDTMHKNYPDAFTSLIYKDFGIGYSLFATIYLYMHDPAKVNKDSTEAILLYGASLINMSKKGIDAALEAVKAEPRFAANPFIDPLRKHVRKDKNRWENADENFVLPIFKLFYYALLLSPPQSALLNLINYILMYNDYKAVFESINCAFLYLLGKTEENSLYADCLPMFLDGLYPKERFLAYFANTDIVKYKDSFNTQVLENEEAALKASKLSEGLGGIILMNVFWEKGKHLDKKAYFEQHFVKNMLGRNNNAVVEEYFLGNSDTAFDKLPKVELGSHENAVVSAALLTAVSAVPERVFMYAFKHKQTAWIERTLASIRKYRSNQAVEDFMDALALPVDVKIAVLIDAYIDEWDEEEKAWQRKQIKRLTGQHAERLEAAFSAVSAKGRAFILETVYNETLDYKPQWLIACLSDSSKMVRDLAVAYLTPQKQLKEQIEPLLQSKTKSVRECAEKLMLSYNTVVTDTGASGEFNILAFCVQNIPASASKTIAWTEFETLPKVRLAGTETVADDPVVIGYIYLFVTQTEMALPPAAAKIRDCLDKDDLRSLGEQLYHIWRKNNAPAKHRGVLVLAAIDCNDAFIRTLKTDIQHWADASRGALAADAVRAMALQGGDLALMTVDAISKKFNNKQVQRAGEAAFQFVAEQLGIDPEALGDRIVPNLGFDSRGEQVIDYGSRRFIATINPALQIELKTAEGKEIKSLPAPGVNDDQVKATAAKEAFSILKKSLKSVASIQCLRLELALSCNRTWTKDAWTKLFVENPIMHLFAIGLVWGVYDANGRLKSSFRYMEDGTFTNVEEDEVVISDDAAIGLCHPLDMGDGDIAAWTQQLADYEIQQPVAQLARKVFRLSDDKKEAVAVTEFSGAVVYAISLLGKLQKSGWSKGSVQDAGGYSNFYKEDKKQGIGVWLNFSGTYVGADTTEEVTVYDAIFYKAGAVQYGSYIYDEIKEADKLKLSDVPARLYSEICYDIERATANRINTN